MGKHKDKKLKKHKKEKKHRKRERKRMSSSSSSSSSEWVEKQSSPLESTSVDVVARDEWMSLPTSFTSTSNVDKKLEREAHKQLEREKEAYNPCSSIRELNPYWKGGGDGLPTFKKPIEDFYNDNKATNYKRLSSANWRKKTTDKSICVEQNKEQCRDEKMLTESEMNILAAKLIKAEIMGNETLVTELKKKLEKAKNTREVSSQHNILEQEIILTQTDTKGYSRPLKLQSQYGEYSGGKQKRQKVETHKDGQRVCYFPDDNKYSLQKMFENEKYSSVEDANRQFMELAGKVRKNDDLDDVFADNIRRKEPDSKIDRMNKDKAIKEHQETTEALDNCIHCLQSDKMFKHLMISMSEAVYLSLPHYEPLTPGHCLLVPIRHSSCSTQLEENEWSEMLNFRKALTEMFSGQNEEVIFFETAMFLHRHPHMVLHCVPVPKDQGDTAPIYFKKAIDESEMEWASNKKLVSLAGRDVRRAIPKGLPYFAVSFGMNEGFAHVIEDQRLFPINFAQEIIGGILDLHHSKWRKPKVQKFEEQRHRIMEFTSKWQKYDFMLN